jgi:hypothetical protein
MVKRVFKDHCCAVTFTAVNTLIVVEEFAHQHLYPPALLHAGGPIPAGLGWYWTAALSFPSSLVLYVLHWPWFPEFLSLLVLLVVGAIQWGAIGAIIDRNLRARHSSANT